MPWYVDVPTDRPVGRNVFWEDEWKTLVKQLITTNEQGRHVCRAVDGEVLVGSPEWKEMLKHLILSEKHQMFWEPKRAKKRSSISLDADGHPVINTLFGVLRGGTAEYAAFLHEQRQARFLRSRRRK